MSIDAIGAIASSIITGVGPAAASRPESSTTFSPSVAGDQKAPAQPPATITTISAEALARQQAAADQAAADQAAADQAAADQTAADQAAADQAAADQAALEAAGAAGTGTVTSAVGSDWAAGTPAVDDAAVQDALDALDEASRENLLAESDAITTQQQQSDLEQKTIDDAATAQQQQSDDIVLAAINAGIQVAFGALATPVTGDPAPRQPGRVDIVA